MFFFSFLSFFLLPFCFLLSHFRSSPSLFTLWLSHLYSCISFCLHLSLFQLNIISFKYKHFLIYWTKLVCILHREEIYLGLVKNSPFIDPGQLIIGTQPFGENHHRRRQVHSVSRQFCWGRPIWLIGRNWVNLRCDWSNYSMQFRLPVIIYKPRVFYQIRTPGKQTLLDYFGLRTHKYYPMKPQNSVRNVVIVSLSSLYASSGVWSLVLTSRRSSSNRK